MKINIKKKWKQYNFYNKNKKYIFFLKNWHLDHLPGEYLTTNFLETNLPTKICWIVKWKKTGIHSTLSFVSIHWEQQKKIRLMAIWFVSVVKCFLVYVWKFTWTSSGNQPPNVIRYISRPCGLQFWNEISFYMLKQKKIVPKRFWLLNQRWFHQDKISSLIFSCTNQMLNKVCWKVTNGVFPTKEVIMNIVKIQKLK